MGKPRKAYKLDLRETDWVWGKDETIYYSSREKAEEHLRRYSGEIWDHYPYARANFTREEWVERDIIKPSGWGDGRITEIEIL